MNRTAIYFMFLIVLNSCEEKKDYKLDRIEVFKSTPVWELAQAVHEHDTVEMKSLLEANPDLANVKESKFNVSLLYWAFYNSPYNYNRADYYKEAKLLIDYGANPFLLNYKNETSFEVAANVDSGNIKFIQLCLNSKYAKQLDDTLKRRVLGEALIVASGKLIEELESVKLLIESGADVNYFNKDSSQSPLSESLIMDNLEIASYLIKEKGASYNTYIHDPILDQKISVIEILERAKIQDDTAKYRMKEQLLSFVKRPTN